MRIWFEPKTKLYKHIKGVLLGTPRDKFPFYNLEEGDLKVTFCNSSVHGSVDQTELPLSWNEVRCLSSLYRKLERKYERESEQEKRQTCEELLFRKPRLRVDLRK